MQIPIPSASASRAPHLETREVIPPEHFAVVEQGIYRSGLPTSKNFSHLIDLNLRTVVVLCAERPQRPTLKFFQEHNISLQHTGLRSWSACTSWKPISDEVVKESLELILRKDLHPVLVCDVGGVHLVGMLVGCLRRLQNWNLNSVVDEYRAFAASRTRYANEQFIELYDIDLVTLPQNIPDWFAEHMEIEQREKNEFMQMRQNGAIDDSGTLLRVKDVHSYKVFYYSSGGPLNTVHGAKPPRLQCL